MKKLFPLLLIIAQHSFSQSANLDAFIRIPHVIDYNFKNTDLNYMPMLATGMTLSYKKTFIDFGTFISESDAHGYFSYAATAIYSAHNADDWIFVLNGFGELTCLPMQQEQARIWIKTAGLSPAIIKATSVGTFAIALTAGAAFQTKTVTFNSRLILNYALPLIRKSK